VADGHGSRRSFRSDQGAKIAVKAAVKALEQAYVEFTTRLRDENRVARSAALSELRGHVQSELPQRVVSGWQDEVDAQQDAKPFTADELTLLSEQERLAVSADPRIAYGSTVIAALLLADYALFLQLGDGDILVVADSGEEPGRPLPPDDRSFANETASLCSPGTAAPRRRPGAEGGGPLADFRVRVVPLAPEPPALVLLTTDGYVNAFVNDAGFRKVASDLLVMGRNKGWEYVRQGLHDWLDEASRQGSGDDVTVALIVREDVHESRGHSAPESSSTRSTELSPATHERGSFTERTAGPSECASTSCNPSSSAHRESP
jgi:serine/threonine protein phosphatase PrpC